MLPVEGIESQAGTGEQLLRSVAIVEADPAARSRIVSAAAKVQNWHQVIADAESHGIANLLGKHLREMDIDIPQSCRQQLTALRVRHLRANRTRMAALAEMLLEFQRLEIRSAVLKGAALINQIYPSADLRPMGDIDLLVPADRAIDARNALRAIGYHAADRNRGALARHHHLPVASRLDNGVEILVEIHTDALSRDSGSSLDWSVVSSDLLEINVEGLIGHVLGYRDMLRHLCHHALEPAERIKLIALADIYGYAVEFDTEIPWQELESRHPFVINMLALLGCIAPPPHSLHQRIPSLPASCPPGAGQGYPPLSITLASQDSMLRKMRRLMSAPRWWLHCFYNVPPQGSLLLTRLLRHPANVLVWIWRRFITGLMDRYS